MSSESRITEDNTILTGDTTCYLVAMVKTASGAGGWYPGALWGRTWIIPSSICFFVPDLSHCCCPLFLLHTIHNTTSEELTRIEECCTIMQPFIFPKTIEPFQ